MPVGELLARTSSRELAEWMALVEIENEERLKADLARRAEARLEARPRRR